MSNDAIAMRMYFDESGTFEPRSGGAPFVGVAVGVAVPASDQAPLFRDFNELKGAHYGCSRSADEVKGHCLNDAQRQLFCRMLDRYPGVLVRPVIMDLRDFHGAAMVQLRDQLRQSLEETSFELPPGEARTEVTQLRSLHQRLSDVQIVRLFAWALCIDGTLRDAAMELVPFHERSSWAALELIVDGPASSAVTREGQFFSPMLQNWMGVWSRLHPFGSAGLPDQQHPLLEHFGCALGLNIRLIVERGLRYRDSATELGLQLADVAAAIVRKAASSREHDRQALHTYGWLMKHASDKAGHGIGLVTPLPDQNNKPAPEFRPLIREYDDAQVRRQIWQSNGHIFI